MRRPQVLALVTLAVVAFVVISALLARAFSADGAERSAITALVQAEARGDVNGAISRLERCAASATCRAGATRSVAAIRRPGSVQILQLEPSTSLTLGGSSGTARVAFRVGSSLPIVQCVRVRRSGNVLSGLRIFLLSVSPPLKGSAGCGTDSGP
jgi:hypothetical protein